MNERPALFQFDLEDRPFRTPESHAAFLELAREHAEAQREWWQQEVERIQREEAISKSAPHRREALRQALYEQPDYDHIGPRQSYEWGE